MPRYLKYDAVAKPSSDEFGVIVNINPNGTVDVDVAVPNDNLGNVIRLTNVPCTNGYVPKIGEWVHIGIYDGIQMVDRSVPNPIVDISTRNTVIVNPNQIASQVIDSAHIRNASIGSAHIQTAAITNAHIANLSADKITTGYLSADRIRGGILMMGGYNNQNGQIYIYNWYGGLVISFNYDGMTVWNSSDGKVSIRVSEDEFASNIGLKVGELYGGGVGGSFGDPIFVRAPLYFYYQNYSTVTETGYCGIGGPYNPNAAVAAGVGVNFRVKKTYTPSSISLSTLSSTRTPYTTDIRSDGFWLYVESGSTSQGYFPFWRGFYTA